MEIDGATVSRCSGYNYSYVFENEIGIGSQIRIIRSGEVIPKIIDVVTKHKLRIRDIIPSFNVPDEHPIKQAHDIIAESFYNDIKNDIY